MQTLSPEPIQTACFPSRLYLPDAELLESPIEFARYCAVCDSEQTFKADRILGVRGLVGSCSRCGDEKFVPFTRTTGIGVCA